MEFGIEELDVLATALWALLERFKEQELVRPVEEAMAREMLDRIYEVIE